MPDVLDRLITAPIVAGCWSWGDQRTWGYGRRFSLADLRDAAEVLLGAGISCFDTAEIYGHGESERIVGLLLGGPQTATLVSTKFFPFPWRLTRRQFVRALRGSLARLGRGQVDIYQIHHEVPWPLMRQWLGHLVHARREGLLTAIGTSNLSLASLRKTAGYLAAHGERVAAHQARYNLCDRRVERDEVFSFCRGHGIVFLAHSPLSQGLLCGKYSENNPPPGTRGSRISKAALRQIGQVNTLTARFGDKLGISPAGVALAWLRHRGAVPLVGVHDAHQARDVVTSSGARLTPAMDRHLCAVTQPWRGPE
jgi:aryl-alcohol dehydrogenase-like predicted oxidoreductase